MLYAQPNAQCEGLTAEKLERWRRSTMGRQADHSSDDLTPSKGATTKGGHLRSYALDNRSTCLPSEPQTARSSLDGLSTASTRPSSTGKHLEIGGLVRVKFDEIERLGTLRFVGKLEDKPGFWAGVELRTPDGKNDGCVGRKRLFECRPGHGIFVRPKALEHIDVDQDFNPTTSRKPKADYLTTPSAQSRARASASSHLTADEEDDSYFSMSRDSTVMTGSMVTPNHWRSARSTHDTIAQLATELGAHGLEASKANLRMHMLQGELDESRRFASEDKEQAAAALRGLQWERAWLMSEWENAQAREADMRMEVAQQEYDAKKALDEALQMAQRERSRAEKELKHVLAQRSAEISSVSRAAEDTVRDFQTRIGKQEFELAAALARQDHEGDGARNLALKDRVIEELTRHAEKGWLVAAAQQQERAQEIERWEKESRVARQCRMNELDLAATSAGHEFEIEELKKAELALEAKLGHRFEARLLAQEAAAEEAVESIVQQFAEERQRFSKQVALRDSLIEQLQECFTEREATEERLSDSVKALAEKNASIKKLEHEIAEWEEWNRVEEDVADCADDDHKRSMAWQSLLSRITSDRIEETANWFVLITFLTWMRWCGEERSESRLQGERGESKLPAQASDGFGVDEELERLRMQLADRSCVVDRSIISVAKWRQKYVSILNRMSLTFNRAGDLQVTMAVFSEWSQHCTQQRCNAVGAAQNETVREMQQALQSLEQEIHTRNEELVRQRARSLEEFAYGGEETAVRDRLIVEFQASELRYSQSEFKSKNELDMLIESKHDLVGVIKQQAADLERLGDDLDAASSRLLEGSKEVETLRRELREAERSAKAVPMWESRWQEAASAEAKLTETVDSLRRQLNSAQKEILAEQASTRQRPIAQDGSRWPEALLTPESKHSNVSQARGGPELNSPSTMASPKSPKGQRDSIRPVRILQNINLSSFPEILELKSLRVFQCAGMYKLLPGRIANSFPVWQQCGGNHFIYSGSGGRWFVGDEEEEELGFHCNAGVIVSSNQHLGSSPDAVATFWGGWQRFDGSTWLDDKDIIIRRAKESPIAAEQPGACGALHDPHKFVSSSDKLTAFIPVHTSDRSGVVTSLHVSAPSVHICAGLYDIVLGKRPNGFPLWKQRYGGHFLYSGLGGRWFVGDHEEEVAAFACNAGIIVSCMSHGGRMPEALGPGSWQRFDGASWVLDSSISISAVACDGGSALLEGHTPPTPSLATFGSPQSENKESPQSPFQRVLELRRALDQAVADRRHISASLGGPEKRESHSSDSLRPLCSHDPGTDGAPDRVTAAARASRVRTPTAVRAASTVAQTTRSTIPNALTPRARTPPPAAPVPMGGSERVRRQSTSIERRANNVMPLAPVRAADSAIAAAKNYVGG